MNWISIAIITYCAWNSRELYDVWRNAPLEHYSWIVLIFWSLPLFFLPKTSNRYLLGLALFTCLMGVLGSLNTLQYIGLALALTSLVPWSWTHLIWIPASITWMPAFSYFGLKLFPHLIFPARMAIAIISSIAVIATRYGKKN